MRPPSLCELEISLQGVKLIMSLEDEYDTLDEVWRDQQIDKKFNLFSFKNPKYLINALSRIN